MDACEFCGVCTIYIYCTFVFKNRPSCKIVRKLLSFFPPHLLTRNPESVDLGCLVLSRVVVELINCAFL